MMATCLAGIDIGTTGIKVAIYDGKGSEIAKGYVEYTLAAPQQYWVELNPSIWWEAVCESLQEIFTKRQVAPQDIKSICVSSTNALVLLDAAGQAIRPAIMQLDQRAFQLLDEIHQEVGEPYVVDKTRNRIACGAFWGPVLLWLKKNCPEELNRATQFMTPHSFINFKFTGVYSIDPSRASTTMLYDTRNNIWDHGLCHYFGVKEEFLPPIHQTLDIVGGITKEAAAMTGLLEGTPVISGCMDSLAGHIGTGAVNSAASLILGSVGRICFDTPQTDRRFMNVKNSVGNSMFAMTPTNSTGISYKWIKEILFDEIAIKQSDIYECMNDMARKSPIGAKGMIYHPYISGERSPIWNPKATGSFFGMTTEHKKEDFIRAVLEGIGYSLAHNYQIVKEELGIEFPCLYASGGGAKSAFWLQTLSNILGVPINVTDNADSETLGAAILAGTAINLYKDHQEGIQQTVKLRAQYVPDEESHAIYKKYLKAYIEIYESTKNLHNTLRELQKEGFSEGNIPHFQSRKYDKNKVI